MGSMRTNRTIGVEEELLLVDPATGQPRPAGDEVVDSAGGTAGDDAGDDVSGGLDHELKREQVELGTEVHRELDDIGANLRALRRRLAHAAEQHGLRLAALATSPLPVEPKGTTDERYERMTRLYGMTARELLCNGCHVHVAVDSVEEAVGVMDRVRPWLAVLTALSANSPFWQGGDSSYASYRQRVWSRWPSAGPSELFGDPAGYRRAIDDMVECGAALDEGMAYLDIRASRQYPTVELRVFDVCLDVEDAVLLAGLARGLVETAAQEWRAGQPAPSVRMEVLRGAAWRAGRFGVSADLVDPLTATTVPAQQQIKRLLAHIAPALQAHGDLDAVSTRLDDVLRRGTGADVQRAAFAQRGELADVVTDAVGRTLR